MSRNTTSIYNTDLLRSKISAVLGSDEERSTASINPFINKNNKLVNPYINYQKVLDNPKVSQAAKRFITIATGLKETPKKQFIEQNTAPLKSGESNFYTTTPNDAQSLTSATGDYIGSVGKKVANTNSYNSGGVYGQCVWYVKGRANEKLGKSFGSWGNANQMWYNAKPSTKLSPTTDNIKPDIIVSYASAPGTDGQKYGHVIYVEDVVGDTVYYTEGGAAYHAKGTDGVVKTTTKQGLLNGINDNGSRMGSNVVGFIDVSKI